MNCGNIATTMLGKNQSNCIVVPQKSIEKRHPSFLLKDMQHCKIVADNICVYRLMLGQSNIPLLMRTLSILKLVKAIDGIIEQHYEA
jgi:hypothetical protein